MDRTGALDFARRTAPKGRPPTAGELWNHRALRAQARLSVSAAGEYAGLMHEALAVIGNPGGEPGTWNHNPHYRSADRWRELWTEVGELLGIGPPPWIHEAPPWERG